MRTVGLIHPGRSRQGRTARSAAAESPIPRSRLLPADILRVASVGLRTRRVRAALSALGVAIGIAAMVAVLGISESSKAGLVAQLNELGTNLLTVAPGQTFLGKSAKLPEAAERAVRGLSSVRSAAAVTAISSVSVRRNRYVEAAETGGIGVYAADSELPATLGGRGLEGRFLDPANERYPMVVVGVGIANVMVISVLERRPEIGLRRALGARAVHIGVQFLGESVLLSALGGCAGIALGAAATAGYAQVQDWKTVVPLLAVAGGVGLALMLGALAGLYPAVRAARLPPAPALRSV